MNNDFIRQKLIPVLIVITTLALAGIAVFTAIRLYQLRNQQVSPNAPTKPQAAPGGNITTKSCEALSFTLSTSSPTPSSSPTGTPTSSPTPTSTPPVGGGTSTPTPTPNPSATPSVTVAPTPTPTGLLDSGFGLPTFGGIALGVLIIIASVFAILAL
ncbi:hypothetical protein HY045_02390 [Candidatus Woesebacteria bacterium]|nr:hypothetical protein [Candidatus Woesebacteria bacterium]